MELTQNTKKYLARDFLKKTIFLAVFLIFLTIPILTNAGTISRPMHHGELVGYWSFDIGKSEGTTVYDLSGNGNNGTLTSATGTENWIDGKFGSGIELDGDDDVVIIQDDEVFNFADEDFTISFWIKATEYSEIVNQDRFIRRGTPIRYEVFFEANGSMAFTIDDGATKSEILRDASPYLDGTWHHVVGVRDTVNNELRLYKDGVQNGAAVADNSGSLTNSNNLYFGEEDSINQHTKGKMDEVRIYSRALSNGEINRLYNLGKQKLTAVNQTGLVGWWTFDEGEMNLGSPTAEIVDKSGNGNTGDWQNHATTTVTGKLGQAIDFDGVNDVIDLGVPSNLNLASVNRFTLSAWVYPTSNPSAAGVITEDFDVVGSPGSVQYELGFDNNISSGMKTSVGFFDGSWRIIKDTVDIINNTWTHISGTWDGTILTLYKNGSFVASSTPGGSLPSTNVDGFFIGRRHDDAGLNDFFPGYIDDVRIYNRALNSEEITSLYKTRPHTFNSSQNNKVTDGLVALWPFDGPDIAGVTAYDRSGNGNDGTLILGPTKTLGIIGQALDFDGTDDYIEDADAENYLNGLTEASVSIWIKSDQIGTDRGFITGTLFDGSDGGLTMRYDSAGAGGLGTNVIQFTFGNVPLGDDGNSRYESASNVQTTDWQHLLSTWRANEAPKLYINGVEDTPTFTTSDGASIDNLSFLRIGQTRRTATPWDGLIDDVRIYNKELSLDEIQRLYNLGR